MNCAERALRRLQRRSRISGEERRRRREKFRTVQIPVRKAAGRLDAPGLSRMRVQVKDRCILRYPQKPGVRRICLDASSFQPERWAEFVQLIHQAGKECYLTLPHIFKTHAIGFFRTYRSCLELAGFDGLLIRAFEEIQWMREEQISLSASFDASVYAWNHGAVHTLKEEQAAFITAPWELNSRELEPVFEACRREGLPAELIVYGRAPMMVSAQCITKTVKGCSKCPSLLWMKDRTGARLPVQNHCAFCYNTILNPLPVSLHGCVDSVKRLAPEGLRLCFTIETGEETKAVLNAFAAEFIRGENAEPPFTEFTRGHFRRGVE